MRIAIFADSHDNLTNLDIFIDWIAGAGIDHMICCGDLTQVDTLFHLTSRSVVPLDLVPGNADEAIAVSRAVDSVHHARYFDTVGETVLDGKRMAFVHYPDKAKQLAQTHKYDYVFHGHTHMPWRSVENACIIVNPGTLAGMFYRATFAVFDTKTNELELKIIDTL